MTNDIAISVKNLTKTYRIFGHPGDRIKQALTFGQKQFHKEFTALKDVSFEIKKGETVGIIGRNGSGKSTLLQLICGILKPTSGSVEVNGRISALLELGAGFNPEFTGRENIYFQGAVLGIAEEEMMLRFSDITAFADIGEFIDQPVRIYSSGMFVRLAFAVAVHVDSEILVVDEALAVGDGAFQAKCLKHIDAIRKRGGTILIVTHAIEQVAHHCDRALLLDYGNLRADAVTTVALDHYVALLKGASKPFSAKAHLLTNLPEVVDCFANHPSYRLKETRWGDQQVTITDILIVQNGLSNPETLIPGLETEIRLQVKYHTDIERPIYGLAIKSCEGVTLFAKNSRQLLPLAAPRSQRAGDIVYPCFTLSPILEKGIYFLSVGVASDQDSMILPHDRRYDSIVLRVATPDFLAGEIDMKPSFIFTLGL